MTRTVRVDSQNPLSRVSNENASQILYLGYDFVFHICRPIRLRRIGIALGYPDRYLCPGLRSATFPRQVVRSDLYKTAFCLGGCCIKLVQ